MRGSEARARTGRSQANAKRAAPLSARPARPRLPDTVSRRPAWCTRRLRGSAPGSATDTKYARALSLASTCPRALGASSTQTHERG